jgi:tripartite-type tricarboxylate transporter receptor subunit TctC
MDPLRKLRVIAASMTFFCIPAQAQDWPSKPIKVLTSLAPGGAADVLVRAVGDELSKNLGQQIVVENRSGGGGALAATAVSNAAPDGYTLLLASPQSLFIAPLLVKGVKYDPLQDFTPLTVAGELPICLVVHKSVPVNSLAELISYARSHPDKLAYGSSGAHSTHHLAGEYFKSYAGVVMTHIPYRGGNPAMTDLLTGQIPLLFATLPTTLQYLDSGQIKVLGLVEATRSRSRPDLPTIGETLPGFAIPSTWLGFVGPRGMSESLTRRVHAELVKAINATAVRTKLESSGFEVRSSESIEEFAQTLKYGSDVYRKIVANAQLQPQ